MTPTDLMTVETLLTHAHFVRGLASALVRDPAVADDVVQQAWLEACRRPPRQTGSPRRWLATVTRNAARREGRGATRRAHHETAAARPEGVRSAAEIVEREEVRRRLVDAVLALEEPYRSAIVLRYLEEFPPRAVAARLGVPVETVRTRVKRGLERLRGALDHSYGGDRRAWGLLLVGWATPTRSAASWGATLAIAAAAIVVGTGGGAWAIGAFGKGPGAALPAAVPADGASGVPAAEMRGGAAADTPPRSEEGRVANPAPAAVPVTGGVLALQAEIERPSVAERGEVALRATFSNKGGSDLKFFIPESHGYAPFPQWRLIADDGTAFRPAARPVQTMWTQGIQGTIRELAPGKTWSHTVRASRFDRIDPKDPVRVAYNTEFLPPGRYRVQCSYGQATEEVPFGKSMFRLERTRVAGLWTGEVAATDSWLAVTQGAEPTLSIRPLGRPAAGDPALLELTVRNPTAAPLLLGDLQVHMSSKAHGSGTCVVPVADLDPVPPRSAPPGHVPARGELRVEVDLARRAYAVGTRGSTETRRFGLYEINPQGIMACRVAWTSRGGDVVLSADAWATFSDRKPAAVAGLDLSVESVGGTRVLVRLTNGGGAPVRVRKRLSWPRDLVLSLVDADDKRKSRRAVTMRDGLDRIGIPDPAAVAGALAWDGDAYERVGPLTAEDFALLPVGGTLTRTLDLTEMISGEIPGGRYRVRVDWRSLVDGRHLGLQPAVVGVVRSEPLELRLD